MQLPPPREHLKLLGVSAYDHATEATHDELVEAQRTYSELQALADKARDMRNDAIERALQARVSQVEVARITGISRARIGQLVRGEALTPKRPLLTSDRNNEIRAQRAQGVPVRALASHYGLSETRIRQIAGARS